MKARILIITICLTIVSFGIQAKVKDAKAITGNSSSDFGKYSIEKAEVPMLINGQELKTYELIYENSDRTVQVGVLPEKKCTNFILKTDMFEIEYVCEKGRFGVKKLDAKYSDLSAERIEAVLDKVGYFSQRVISQKPKTEDEILGLIACYYPNLIKDEYKVKF